MEQRKVDDFRAIEKKQTVVQKKEKPQEKHMGFEDQKKIKSLKNRLSSTESDIASLEKEIAAIDHDLLMNYDATIAKANFFDSYQKKKKNLESLMKTWENITLELEEISL